MKSIMALALSACALAGCAGTLNDRAAQSCPASIPAPILEAGDTWRWQDEKGANWYLRYIRRTDDGLFEKEPRVGGPSFYYDTAHTLRKVFRDGQWITDETVDYRDIGKPPLVFPLSPGKTWSHTLLARSVDGVILTYSRSYTVVRCETVTVPAGAFFAVVIEEYISTTSWSGKRLWWYAPEVKYFVKLEHKEPRRFWSAFQDWQLTSYQITPPPTRVAVPSPSVSPAPPPSGTPSPSPTASNTPPREPNPISGPVTVPMWERGYEWKYRWTSPRGSGTFVWTVVRDEAVAGVPYYVVKTGGREIFFTKADLAWLMDRVEGVIEIRGTPALRILEWPLAVAKEWEQTYSWENPVQRQTEERLRRCNVEGRVVIDVPAGSFWAFHVTVKDPTGRLTNEYWYAPEVRFFVKERRFFSYGVEERDLLEYKLRATIAPAP